MSFNWIDAIVLVAYLVGILGLGLRQARNVRSSGDFFAGGRKFGRFLMMMHSLGTGTHADDPVGVAGASFRYGISGIWYTFVYLFVTPFYWIIAPFFRRSRFLTTADFFEARFGAGLSTVYAVWGMVLFAINIGTLLIGTGKIVDAVSLGAINSNWAIAGMTVAFLAYGTAGGLVATVVTESVQGLLIVVMSLLLVPFGFARIGGFGGLRETLRPEMFELTGPQELSLWWVVAGLVMSLINIVAQPHTMEVCSAGRTEFEGRVGFTYGSFVKRFCALGWMLTGLLVTAMVARMMIGPIAREQAFGTAIRELLPAGLTGLMFAAILAAQMSTLSAFMVAASALMARNIYRFHFSRTADDARLLKVGRWAGLATVGLGLLFAFTVQGVADALVWFWTLSTFTGLLVWGGVLWRRANATGAWAAFVTMLVIWALVAEPGDALARALAAKHCMLGMFANKSLLHYRLLSFLPAGILAFVVGSLLGTSEPKAKLDGFYTLITTPVGRESELASAGIDAVYAGQSEGHPWELHRQAAVNIVGFIVALLVSSAFLGLLWLLSRAMS